MEIFDNVQRIVKTDLEASIEKGSRLSIAAACFSLYAYQALRKQLDGIEELRFIFTSPTFVKECVTKDAIDRDEQRQKLQREIDALAKKVQAEKQFNRQIALNKELKRLRREAAHGQAEV